MQALQAARDLVNAASVTGAATITGGVLGFGRPLVCMPNALLMTMITRLSVQ